MELVLLELDVGVELDATECLEVAGAELGGDTVLNGDRDRRMEPGRDGRHEPIRRTCGTGRGNAGEWRR